MLPEFVDKFSEFLSVSHYLPPIPWNADVVRSYAKRTLALDFERGNEFTLAALQSVKALPFATLTNDLNAWSDKQASMLREPINEQYNDLEEMLLGVSRQISELKEKRSLSNVYRISITSGALIVIPIFMAILSALFGKNDGDIPLARLVSWMTNISSETWLSVIAVSMSLVSGITIIAIRYAEKNARFNPVLDRLTRQREVYVEKLKELEHIRAADYGTIVKSRSSLNTKGQNHRFL